MGSFDEKVAIVTGGGPGLGEAISKLLASRGAFGRGVIHDGGYYMVDGGYTTV